MRHRMGKRLNPMTLRCRHLSATIIIAFGSLAMQAVGAQSPEQTPNDWLNKMARAVQTTNYEGTVIRVKDDRVEVLKVVHVVADGVVHEKIVTQEGNGLEIIRNGNEIQCILPDKKSVLIDEWHEKSNLFSTLPSSDIRFGGQYDVLFDGNARVAGRKAVILAVKPHDEYRFGHRVWIDTKTGFPLKTMLIGDDGSAIEQVKFADIVLDREIHASALQPSSSTDGFRWITEPRRKAIRPIASEWNSGGLPPGFRVMSTHAEELPGSDALVTHILLSDGLVDVSVIVQPSASEQPIERSQVGASNSFSYAIDGHVVTAVGDVPAATVEQIARSMHAE